ELLNSFTGGVGTQDDDRNASCHWVGLEQTEHLRPIDVGEVHIEKDDIWFARLGELYPDPAEHRTLKMNAVPRVAQTLHEFGHHRVVLDVQDAEIATGAVGAGSPHPLLRSRPRCAPGLCGSLRRKRDPEGRAVAPAGQADASVHALDQR